MKQLEVIKQAFALAKENLVSFRSIILSQDVAIESFRESAKTQYIMRAFPLYCLCFPREDRSYIVLVKNNTLLARNKLREIQTEYETNPAVRFNLKRILEQSADVFSVDGHR